jgi:hypothetical protein
MVKNQLNPDFLGVLCEFLCGLRGEKLLTAKIAKKFAKVAEKTSLYLLF